MVTEYGFSDKLGRLRYTDNDEEVFLGHSVARHKNVSDATAELIDKEVRSLIEVAESTARKILTDKAGDLEALAQALLEYETLSGADVNALLKGEPIIRPDTDDESSGNIVKSSVPISGTATKKADNKNPGGDFNPEPQPEG
jgi:cell division protease FtsH